MYYYYTGRFNSFIKLCFHHNQKILYNTHNLFFAINYIQMAQEKSSKIVRK